MIVRKNRKIKVYLIDHRKNGKIKKNKIQIKNKISYI